MLNSETLSQLKTLAKDESSYEELKKLFSEICSEKETVSNYLELLEAAIRNDYDSILITDLGLEKPGPKIVYVNDGFEKMTGYSREEVIGKTPRILQGPKTDRKVLDKLKDSLEKGNSFFGQTVNYRKDGSEYINQWDIHPLINKDGKITHWVSYQHDITERKRAEQKIVDSTLEFDDLLQDSKKAFIDLKVDGTIVEANKAFREMLGYQRKEEIKDRKIWDLTPAKFSAAVKSIFSGDLVTELKTKNEHKLIFRRKNGLPVQVEIVMKPVVTDGAVLIRGDINNISLRKNVLKILQKRTENFNKIFQRKNDFTYGYKLDESGSAHILWVSDEFADFTGFSKDECLGPDGFSKLIHEDDMGIVSNHYKMAADGKSSCKEFRIVCKDGSVKQIMDYSKPDNDAEQNGSRNFISSVVAVTKDKSLNLI